jgi:parvulin-like peptidyl-prolyl isomerase
MIKSQGGLYIFKVREKEEAKELSFDEVKEDIKNHLLDEKHLEMEGNLENELLEKSKLIIYDKTLRVLLETNLKK